MGYIGVITHLLTTYYLSGTSKHLLVAILEGHFGYGELFHDYPIVTYLRGK